MNDFTKTELAEISRCLQYMIKGCTTPHSCLTIGLKKKVRLMIENYCEHEWENPCCGCSESSPYCEKCKLKLYQVKCILCKSVECKDEACRNMAV